MAHINLNRNLCGELRNKINEYQHYSIAKTHSIKKANGERGWEKICAIMDRLDDTSERKNLPTDGKIVPIIMRKI